MSGVLDQRTVADLRDRIDAAVAAGAEGVDVRVGTVWIRDAAVLGDAIDRLAAATAVREAVAELLGSDPVPMGGVMRNPVGETAQQALHVDWAGAIHPGGDQQAQAMFFLDDVDETNGATRVVPGTHRSGRVPPRAMADPSRGHPDERLIVAAAGDVLVLSSHTWHSGTANRSGRPRRTITVTYRRAV